MARPPGNRAGRGFTLRSKAVRSRRLFIPANNDFANATALNISTFGALTGQSNILATLEAGEPTACAGFSCVSSVWYSFTPTFTGSMAIGVRNNPGLDALCSVNTGSAVNALTVVGSFEANGAQNCLNFAATSGTTYYLRVTGYSAASSTGSFEVVWVPNDDIVNATILPTISGTATEDCSGAAFAGGEPSPFGGYTGGTTWWRIKTGNAGGASQFDTIGSNALSASDSVIGVYTSSLPSAPTYASLTLVAGDDQTGGNQDAKVTPTLAAFTDYFIQVMPQYNDSQARKKVVFNWSVPAPIRPFRSNESRMPRVITSRQAARL